MSKYLKTLIITCLVVCMSVCLGIFAAACVGGGNDFTYPSSIDVTVLLDDGTPAVGVGVQICTVADDGTSDSANCKLPVSTNAQGVASITSITEADGNKFEVHISSIPDTYKYYSYVDDNGTRYEGTGARIDVTKSNTATVKLAIVPVKDTIYAGGNTLVLDKIDEAVTLKANIESAGWYQITSINNAYKLSGNGYEITDERYDVNIYLKPNDELTFNFTDESRLTINLDLKKLPNGNKAKPLPAIVDSLYVMPLDANQTVYVTNDTVNGKIITALEVSGTNFKATYEETTYTDTFSIKAPAHDNDGKLIAQTFEVGTANGQAGVVILSFDIYEDIGGEIPVDLPEIKVGEQFTVSEASMFGAANYILTISEDGNYKFDTEINVAADIVVGISFADDAADDAVYANDDGVFALTAGTYYVSFYDNGTATLSKI